MDEKRLELLKSKHLEAEGDVIREAYLNGMCPASYAIALVNASRELLVEQENRIITLEHDLHSVTGLYAIDKQPDNEPDAFRLRFASLAKASSIER